MPVLDVRGVVKRFGTVTAVDGVSFAVGAGARVDRLVAELAARYGVEDLEAVFLRVARD